MRKTCGLVVLLAIGTTLIFSHVAVAEIKGDFNGDHRIDLQEAIYALQVVAGLQVGPTIDQEEVEPNNEPYKAVPIPENAIITGNIGSGDDKEDWYKIVMPANGLLQYSLENLNPVGTEQSIIGITRLYQKVGLDLVELNSIYVKNGYETYNISPGDSPISAYIAVSADSVYYIKVPKNSDHTAPYELRVFFTLLETIDVGEANDSSDDAYKIEENGTVEALIGYGDNEEDWYEITPSANGLLQYSVENLHPSTSGIDQGIIGISRLYQKIGLDLIELNSIYVKNGYETYNISPGDSPASSYTAVSSGSKYYIKVPKYGYNSAPYELKATFIPLGTTDVGEANDSSDDAYKIEENGTVEALIGYGNDEEDWYEITPSANGLLQYSVENLHPSTSGIDQGIIGITRLYQKIGLDLTELNSIYVKNGYETYNISPGDSPASSYTAVSSGSKYYIKVPKYGYNSAPYELKATFIPLETTDSGEANDSFANAHTIEAYDTITALIGYGNDEEDWYKLTVSANGSFQFELENLHYSTSGIDQGIIGITRLYKQDGLDLSEVASIYVKNGYETYNISPGDSPKSNSIAVSGGSTYYIKVPKYDYNAAPYTLKTFYLAD